MNTERLLQITVATLAALATLLLSISERNAALPTAVAIAAFLSVWLTDVRGWFSLNRLFAGTAAVVAMLFCMRNLFPIDPVFAFLDIARFLVYLQVILLFQKKDLRIYSQLIVLSFLQVVVSTVYNQGIWFGLLMIVYMFTALLAFMLLCLLREQKRYHEQLKETDTESDENAAAITTADVKRPKPADGLAAFAIPAREIFTRVGVMGIGTLVFTALAFFILPRLGQPAWRGHNLRSRNTTGYTNAITLRQTGRIFEDPKEVMRVKILDPETNQPVPVFDDIYLQGSASTYYLKGLWYFEAPIRNSIFHRERFHQPGNDPKFDDEEEETLSSKESEPPERIRHERRAERRRTHWSRRSLHRWSERWLVEWMQKWTGKPPLWYRMRRRNPEEVLTPPENPPETGVVRQEIAIEFTNLRELFVLHPYFVKQPSLNLKVSKQGDRVMRAQKSAYHRFTYSLYTTAIVNGRQTQYIPTHEQIKIKDLLQTPPEDSPDGLPNLTKLAEQWMSQTKTPPDNWMSRARFLDAKLKNDERFSYTLQGHSREEEIDPIEDFIVNNPQGHCEYFATALTLMLRSQGIPARIVAGYKCGEFNELGGFFQVRYRDAHTWVEVFLPREKAPPAFQQNESITGVWMRFDPTPAASADLSQIHPWLQPAASAIDWLEYAWDNYVMEMDRSRQEMAIYQPLVNWCKTTSAKLKDPKWWRRLGRSIRYRLNPRHWEVDQWFSWRGGLIGMMICAALVFTYRGCRHLFRTIRSRMIANRRRRAARIEVAFYRRLNSILAKRGLLKTNTQTPREFARLAAKRLAASPETRELAALPGPVVEAFYLVRFGRASLDVNKQEEIELSLTRLEQAGRVG